VHAVPEASQVSITPGAASLTTGFPPLNFQSYTAGGIPPFGNDLNGILNQITAWQRWTQAGGYPRYNAAYQTAIGGYPSGAVLMAATNNGMWVSTADSNMTNPDTGGAGWSWMNGSATQVFNVAPATAATHAVRSDQLSADNTNFPIYTPPTAWTPTFTSITQVGATSNTFYYVKIGKIVFFQVTLQAATSTVCNAGSSVITTPTTPSTRGSTCTAVNIGTSASLGVGSVFSYVNGILPPTISVGAGVGVYISGFYMEP
jgi:hypothetical protein